MLPFRSSVAAVVAALAALGVLGAPAASAAAASVSASTSPAASASARTTEPSITVAPENDGVVKANGSLSLTVTVRNRTGSDLPQTSAELYLIRTPVGSRTDLSNWLGDTSIEGYLGSAVQPIAIPVVPAHQSVSVTGVTVPSALLRLTGTTFGARKIAVAYQNSSSNLVGRAAFTWEPSTVTAPTGVSVAMPITVPATTGQFLTAASLAADTGPAGTLTAQLDATAGRNVALGIDPRIIVSIRRLGVNAPPSALAWLDRLERTHNEKFALPYADADVTGLRQAGATSILAPIALDQGIDPKNFPGATTPPPTPTGTPTGTVTPLAPPASSTGTTAAATPGAAGSGSTATGGSSSAPGSVTSQPAQPGNQPTLPTTATLTQFPYALNGMAWPTEDSISTADLDALALAGDTTTIVASANTTAGSNTTLAASETISAHHALVSDSKMSGLLQEAVTAGSDTVWNRDVAMLTATLATVTREGAPGTVLLTLDRMWPSDPTRLARTLDALDSMDWVTPTDLTTAAAAAPGSVNLADHHEPDTRRDQLARLVHAESQVAAFATAVTTPALVTAPFRLNVLTAASKEWRADPAGLQRAVDQVAKQATATASSVGVVDSSSITLLGDKSSLPVSVRNKSAWPVTVMLTVTPSNSFLRVTRPATQVTVQPDSTYRVTIPVQSVANGKVQVMLSLTSPTGVRIAPSNSVEINVQAQWESIITGLAAAAVVLIFGLGIVRNIRRRIRRRRLGLPPENEPDPNRPIEPDSENSATAHNASGRGADAQGPWGGDARHDDGFHDDQWHDEWHDDQLHDEWHDDQLRDGLFHGAPRSASQQAGALAAAAEAQSRPAQSPESGAVASAAIAGAATALAAPTGDQLQDAIDRSGAGAGLPGGPRIAPDAGYWPKELPLTGASQQPQVDASSAAERGLGRASALLAAGTMFSRVLGFVKTFVLAAAIGQSGSDAANAFAVSNQLPNSVYTLIAGGLLSAALIPQIVRATRHPDGGQRYINKIVTIGVVVFLAVTIVATVAAPVLVGLYSQSASHGGKGFSEATTALAVAFAFWCLPQILFYALYSLLGEVLNARQVFGPFTWAPLLNNVIAIAGLIVFIALFGTRQENSAPIDWNPTKIAVLAGTATLGVAVQAAFLVFFWRRAGLTYRPDFRWRGVGLRGTGTAAGWLFLMILTTQLAGIVQSRVSSLGAGAANATLQNAWLLFMLPHSIITVSIATAYFTRMSHDAERGDLDAVRRNLSLSLRIVGLFTVFASVALMVVAFPFARLYEHTFGDVRAMAGVLLAYMPGLVLFSMLFIIQRAFWAMHDHRTPFLMQLVQSGLFVIGALAVAALPGSWIGVGVAAVTTLAGCTQTVIALIVVRRRLAGVEGRLVTRSHVQFIVAALVAGGAGLVVAWFFGAFRASGFAMTDVTSAGITLLLTSAVMGAVYFAGLVVLRNPEVRSAVTLLRGRVGR